LSALKRSSAYLALAVLALLAGALWLLAREKPERAAAGALTASPAASLSLAAPGLASVPATPSAAAPAPSLAPDALDERSLMLELRRLRGSNPPLTLRLAREGNERFAHSPDAAERSWFIVKSLSELGRHDEARAEGRILVERHRDTRWAEDVYRHLFVNPPTHPAERGYGKVLESD
jgi:hypothetical protein